jgi:hypothetical protein
LIAVAADGGPTCRPLTNVPAGDDTDDTSGTCESCAAYGAESAFAIGELDFGRGGAANRRLLRGAVRWFQLAFASSSPSWSDMASRSLPRSLRRVGPMLPIGMARLALICAYEGAGSAKSITIS